MHGHIKARRVVIITDKYPAPYVDSNRGFLSDFKRQYEKEINRHLGKIEIDILNSSTVTYHKKVQVEVL